MTRVGKEVEDLRVLRAIEAGASNLATIAAKLPDRTVIGVSSLLATLVYHRNVANRGTSRSPRYVLTARGKSMIRDASEKTSHPELTSSSRHGTVEP